MVSFIGRLFGRLGGGSQAAAETSGKLAKDRLQLVLVQDRIDMPADKMQAMQKEIIDVISKYVMVDIDNVDFELSNRERDGLLVAEIPFKPVKVSDNHHPTPVTDDVAEDTPTEAEETDASIAEDADDLGDEESAMTEASVDDADDVDDADADATDGEAVEAATDDELDSDDATKPVHPGADDAESEPEEDKDKP